MAVRVLREVPFRLAGAEPEEVEDDVAVARNLAGGDGKRRRGVSLTLEDGMPAPVGAGDGGQSLLAEAFPAFQVGADANAAPAAPSIIRDVGEVALRVLDGNLFPRETDIGQQEPPHPADLGSISLLHRRIDRDPHSAHTIKSEPPPASSQLLTQPSVCNPMSSALLKPAQLFMLLRNVHIGPGRNAHSRNARFCQ